MSALLKRQSTGTQLISQEIQQKGPMNFAEFVDLALYHPRYGYYNRIKLQRGRQGDYVTSMQISALFPEIFADVFLSMKRELGTNQFFLIEVGAGSGEFLEQVLRVLEAKKESKGVRVWAIEKSRSARDQLWKRLSRFPKCEVFSSLEEADVIGGVDGVIFSNEFFDAIPFHRLRFTQEGWKEIYVQKNADTFEEIEAPLSRPDLVLTLKNPALEFQVGQEIEVRPDLSEIWESWSRALARGYVVSVDYGYPRAHLYSPHRAQGTWQSFYKHTRPAHPYDHIGEADLTAHVDFTQLVELGERHNFKPAFFGSQGLFLSFAGQELIAEFVKNANQRLDTKALGAVQQLLHPDAMGEAFQVLLQTKDVEIPTAFSAIPNKIHRLKN